MKLGRFEHNGKTFYGIVEEEEVHELDGSPFATYRRTDRRHRLSALKLLVPCLPSNFYCAGLNYAAHIEWANAHHGGNYHCKISRHFVLLLFELHEGNPAR